MILFAVCGIKVFLIRKIKELVGYLNATEEYESSGRAVSLQHESKKNCCVEKITTTISIMFSNQMAYLKTKKQSVTGKHF